MARREHDSFVSPTDKTIPFDSERTIATPRFDEKSVQGARPAVPLNLRGRARAWPGTLVVACVVAALLGGMLGGLGLALYQSKRSRAESPPATQEQSQPAQTNDGVNSQPAAPAASSTAAQEEKPAAQDAPKPEEQQTASGNPAQDAEKSSAPAADDADAGDGAGEVEPDAGTRGQLRTALGGWLAATNARNIGGQMKFYAPTVDAYYLERNASREDVRAEKTRVFSQVGTVNIRASDPEIRLSRDGRTAVMLFRKRYQIGSGDGGRSGEVLQELRWRRTAAGWKIVSERDLRVLQ